MVPVRNKAKHLSSVNHATKTIHHHHHHHHHHQQDCQPHHVLTNSSQKASQCGAIE